MLSCPICQDGITENENNNYPWVLSCGHVYHKVCFDRLHNNNCPKCRKLVIKGFRLYPDMLNKDESFTCLLDSIQSAEDQYTRQKKVSADKSIQILRLENTLKETELKNTELRTANVNLAKVFNDKSAKLNVVVLKLEDSKRHLNNELNKSAEKISRHKSTIIDLQRELQHEKEEMKNAEIRLNQQIQALTWQLGQVEKSKQEALAGVRAKCEQVNQLQSLVNNLLAQTERENNARKEKAKHSEETVESSDEEAVSRSRGPDSAIEELTSSFDRVLSRKRRVADDAGPLSSERERTLKKQQRSMSQERDDTAPRDGDTGNFKVEASTSSQARSPSTESNERGNETSATKTRRKKYDVRKILKVVRRSEK